MVYLTLTGAVSDWGQGSRPQSERAWRGMRKKMEKGEKDIEASMKYLTVLFREEQFFFKKIHSDAALKTLPIAVISHIPDAFLIGLRI